MRRTEARKREANPVVVGEALEEVVAHSHIPAEREQVKQEEVEEAHNHIQVQEEEEVHPYPDTSRQHKPHQSLPDPMASLRLYRQKRTL
jgi:hypothetical protein